jgi:hypothetical protein
MTHFIGYRFLEASEKVRIGTLADQTANVQDNKTPSLLLGFERPEV